jgi:aryl sulfotransferase
MGELAAALASSALPLGAGQIVWLASYPKSGNTWLRSLLTAYRQGPQRALDINALGGWGAASRTSLDELLGLDTAEMSSAEVHALLPHAYRSWSRLAGGPHWLKTHEAYTRTRTGEPLFPAEATRCVLHIVRDPRDVAVSAQHHWGLGLDETITRLNNPEQWVAEAAESNPRVAQRLSDWSGHACSWLEGPLPRLTLRYEDLLADPAAHLHRVLAFLDETLDEARLQHAVAACALERLQAQEGAGGFNERLQASTAPFFRSGRAGGWREALSPAQQDRIVGIHGPAMRLFGYET